MNSTLFALITIAIIALVTALIRFAPFVIFAKSGKSPAWINYLGKVLPYSIMAMLVVFCLKGVSFSSINTWLPELIASICVVLLHLWRKNTLLSITCGTVLYMLLVQLVFN